MSKKKYKRKITQLEASFAKDDERANMRVRMNTQFLRRRALQAQNGYSAIK